MANDKSKINRNHSVLCGMSKDEFESNHSRAEMIYERIPKALDKLNVESEKVRHHFSDDPDALKKWDEYMDDINYSISSRLPYFLSSRTQNSLLYKQLMRRKVRPTPSVGILTGGYEKVKQATRSKMVPGATIAAAFATGIAVGHNLWKQEQINKT